MSEYHKSFYRPFSSDLPRIVPHQHLRQPSSNPPEVLSFQSINPHSSDPITRFDRFMSRQMSPNRGWPGDLAQLGYFLLAGSVSAYATQDFNDSHSILNMSPETSIPIILAETIAYFAVTLAGTTLSRRLIDYTLPEDFSKKPHLLPALQPFLLNDRRRPGSPYLPTDKPKQ